MSDAQKTTDTFTRLINILNEVKTVLKTGDFAALRKLTDRQNKLFSKLVAQHRVASLNAQQIEILGQLAGQNQRYLTAAKAGIRSATNRRRAVKNARTTSQTYDRKGQRLRLENHPDSFEKHS